MGRRVALGLAALVLLAVVVLATSWSTGPSAGAKALESRLYAPCCYVGTLDNHESELARSLRAEIEARFARGESTANIQADFVARYGDKVIAAQSETSTRSMGLLLSAAATALTVGLFLLLRKWLRRPAGEDVRPTKPTGPDDLDRRIDADLAELDG
jgi:cytochrome c-type biogenesis protein CcmH